MKKLFFVLTVIAISIMTVTASLAAELPSEWATSEVAEAIALRFVPDELQSEYTKNITRAEFAKAAMFYLSETQNLSIDDLMNCYREKSESLTGHTLADVEPLIDTEDIYVIFAYTLGVVNGRGNGIFDPNSPITRQEAAVMLANAHKLFGTYTTEDKAGSFGQTFFDSGDVAGWAYEAVAVMYQFGVMNGTSGDIFSPLGYYTREQCIATFLRLYKNAPPTTVLLPYEEACERIIGADFFLNHLEKEFHCAEYSVFHMTQSGTPHGRATSLWIAYRSGGRREILHPGDGLPSNSFYRTDIEIYDLEISEDKSTLTFKRDFNDKTYNYSVDLLTATLTEI